MPKQVYTWGKVKAGDIISFRYKGKQLTPTLTTILVLNPRIPYTRKDKTKVYHLVGLKLVLLMHVIENVHSVLGVILTIQTFMSSYQISFITNFARS